LPRQRARAKPPGARLEGCGHRKRRRARIHRRDRRLRRYLIPSGFGKSIAITGGPQLALVIYLAFYAVCLALTWWFYLRKSPAASGATSLAEARV